MPDEHQQRNDPDGEREARPGHTVRTPLVASKIRVSATPGPVKVTPVPDGPGARPHVTVTSGGVTLSLPCDDRAAFVAFLHALRDAAQAATHA